MTVHNSTSYDEIPYPGGAYQQSHPDRMETLATLFGMEPRDVRRCRVLELGCADGANLIPMACAFPESNFVGVDLSARQVEPGHETIRALGLRNVELRHGDIRDVDAGFGTFDYIIAHGVYSWVPAEVQEKMLSICREQLTPNGVAYISYNTYPGWRMRGMLRDMMLYHSGKFDEPQMQIDQARALINWLAETVEAESSPYGLLLKRELENMQNWKDTYFRHDSLAEINEPVYFHQFVAQAERQGLQFLSEAELPTMLASNFSAPLRETLERLSRDIIEMEQYSDFVRNRMFRQTLLCHRGIKLTRSLGPWSLPGFHMSAQLRPAHDRPDLHSGAREEFRTPNAMTVSTSEPIAKAALVCLSGRWPGTIFFPDLVRKARALLRRESAPTGETRPDFDSDSRVLAESLMPCVCKWLCELHAHPLPLTPTPEAQPQACPYVRLQATRGNVVTNRRHEQVTLDNFDRHLLPLLDGQRDGPMLVEELTRLVADGSLAVTVEEESVQDSARVREIMAGQLDGKLRQFGQWALLVGA